MMGLSVGLAGVLIILMLISNHSDRDVNSQTGIGWWCGVFVIIGFNDGVN